MIITYNKNEAQIIKYYQKLGVPGQAIKFPFRPRVSAVYNNSQKFISYIDVENNVWHYEKGQMEYIKTLNFSTNELLDFSPTKLISVSKEENSLFILNPINFEIS